MRGPPIWLSLAVASALGLITGGDLTVMAFQVPHSLDLRPTTTSRLGEGPWKRINALRMTEHAIGNGPYKGPSSFPLLDSVRYPRDMKRFSPKVRYLLLTISPC